MTLTISIHTTIGRAKGFDYDENMILRSKCVALYFSFVLEGICYAYPTSYYSMIINWVRSKCFAIQHLRKSIAVPEQYQNTNCVHGCVPR